MPTTVRIKVPRLDLAPGPSVMQEVGDFAIRLITTRTQRGLDIEGRPFASLTPAYAKVKQAETGSSAANLTVSGRMLNDLVVTKASGTSAVLGFRSRGGRAPRGAQTLIQRSRAVGAEDKAFWHQVTGAGKARTKRPFFGLSDADGALIRERLQRWLTSAVQAAQRGTA